MYVCIVITIRKLLLPNCGASINFLFSQSCSGGGSLTHLSFIDLLIANSDMISSRQHRPLIPSTTNITRTPHNNNNKTYRIVPFVPLQLEAASMVGGWCFWVGGEEWKVRVPECLVRFRNRFVIFFLFIRLSCPSPASILYSLSWSFFSAINNCGFHHNVECLLHT